MSTIHFSAAELANVAAVLEVRSYGPAHREATIKTLAEVAVVNAFAHAARYNEQTAAVTAEEIVAASSPVGASLERAISTATLLEYNCDGFMCDRLRGDVGRLCGQLARLAQNKLDVQREQLVSLQRTAAERAGQLIDLRAQLAAAKSPRARKSRATDAAAH